MKILFLTSGGAMLPSVRFRVLPFVERGRVRGHDVDWMPIPRSSFARMRFLWSVPRADVYVIQQSLFSERELSQLKKRCGALVYDFDNAVWAFPHDEIQSRSMRKRSQRLEERFLQQCAVVDCCIAGNAYLAEKASRTQARVRVVPTGIDTAAYVAGSRCTVSDYFQVGWMGTANTMRYLDAAMSVLEQYAGSVQFSVVSDRQYDGHGKEYVFWSKWAADMEIPQLQSMDVGLVPLADDEYTRGKCGFKILQYMACGAVPVAAAVGSNTEIIEHGSNGFLVQEPAQWGEFVMRLATDRNMYTKMRAAARETVTSRFDIGVVGQGVWESLDEAMGYMP